MEGERSGILKSGDRKGWDKDEGRKNKGSSGLANL